MSKTWRFMMDSYLKKTNNLFGTGIHPRCTWMTRTSTYILPIHHLRSTEKNTCSSQFSSLPTFACHFQVSWKKTFISFGFTTPPRMLPPFLPRIFFNIFLLEGILIDTTFNFPRLHPGYGNIAATWGMTHSDLSCFNVAVARKLWGCFSQGTFPRKLQSTHVMFGYIQVMICM